MTRTAISWLSLTLATCLVAADSSETPPRDPTWIGVYSSPSEIGDLHGTVLSVEKTDRPMTAQHFTYRLFMYSDLVTDDEIPQKELSGDILVEGERLFLPIATGYHYPNQNEPVLNASLYRYTRMTIHGRVVLLRDDALRHYLRDKSLYDYGVLIKVADDAKQLTKLADAKHESIKILYDDPKKEWKYPSRDSDK
jgi:hypothetical protein